MKFIKSRKQGRSTNHNTIKKRWYKSEGTVILRERLTNMQRLLQKTKSSESKIELPSFFDELFFFHEIVLVKYLYVLFYNISI